METVNTFATFITNLALVALIALVVIAVMIGVAKILQSIARRRMIAATKRGYLAAGKPAEPRADRRNRSSFKRAA